jgi:hypothetical protein
VIGAELLAVVIGGFAAGFLLVEYLTVHPLFVGRTMLLWCVSLFATGLLIATRFAGLHARGGVGHRAAGFATGYLLRARSVLGRRDPRIVPDLEPPGPEGRSGHTAVVYFTHGEPETFDPIGWIDQFREFDEDGIRFVPFPIRPIFIYRLRQSYLRVGKSNHRQMHCRMCRLLEERLREAGHPDVRAYVSFLDDDPRPDAALVQAINDGASRIVVAEVFTTVSNHTAKGKQLIAEVPIAGLGIEVIHTCPLWDSATLHRMFLDKVEAATGDTDRSKVGVLLVGYGQPAEWDREFATETEQEIAFRQSVLDLLADNGYVPGAPEHGVDDVQEPPTGREGRGACGPRSREDPLLLRGHQCRLAEQPVPRTRDDGEGPGPLARRARQPRRLGRPRSHHRGDLRARRTAACTRGPHRARFQERLRRRPAAYRLRTPDRRGGMMVEYTVPLALYDFLPVVFTAVALYWVVRMVVFISPEMGRMAAVGALLVVTGGTAKATWKLIMAASGGTLDIRWLDASLFIFMAPGFILLACAVWGLTRIVRDLSPVPARILGPLGVVATLGASVAFALAAPGSPAWSRVLLGTMVFAALALSVLFIIFAIRERLHAATVLLLLNLAGTLALNAMARLPEQTIPLQWAEQTVNAASWLAFAVAANLVYAHTRERFGVDPAARTASLDRGAETA